ncbi:MAG TPA: M23 family metallopeptidase, partial [Gemmatimonadales bacterium]|nr:M23 family metallopeptidase [Gemmatimonadales bacterium]
RGERIKLTYELADVNEWSVDFTRDVQPGDRFVAVVERQISEDGEVRLGAVLASDLSIGHKSLQAYRYTHTDGSSDFYDGSGNAVRRAFLKVPVAFRYISSPFSFRVHPILGTWLKHQGTDYAAPMGTPVRAAGTGVVTIAGWHGDYGNMIEIRHTNGITTRYGHLSHIEANIKPGVHVAQSDVIGEVGMTGMATGPHLHYEFRVDGVARDPESVKTESGPPLPNAERGDFQRQRAILAALLNPGSPVPASSSVTD